MEILVILLVALMLFVNAKEGRAVRPGEMRAFVDEQHKVYCIAFHTPKEVHHIPLIGSRRDFKRLRRHLDKEGYREVQLEHFIKIACK